MAAETGFLERARGEYRDRYHDLAAARRNWQLVALFALLLDGFLSVGLFYQAARSRISPYVVEVDRLGHAMAFGPAVELKAPEERFYRYALSSWIVAARTVYGPEDVEPQRRAANTAYAYVRGEAAQRLTSYYSTHNPILLSRDRTVSVEIRSVLKTGADARGATFWELEWVESHRGRGGSSLERQLWRASARTLLDPPRTSDTVLLNPLGLYLVSFDWTLTSTQP